MFQYYYEKTIPDYYLPAMDFPTIISLWQWSFPEPVKLAAV